MTTPPHETAAEVAGRITVPTADEMRDWPVTVSVPTGGRPYGLGREASYRAAAAGQLPGAIRVGRRWCVVTAELRRALGVDDGHQNGHQEDKPT